MDIHDHLGAAYDKARRARAEARALLDSGFPGPSLVWSVRAAEILLRDFVLTPHFLSEGADWPRAMRQGSNVLGTSLCPAAFAMAEDHLPPVVSHQPSGGGSVRIGLAASWRSSEHRANGPRLPISWGSCGSRC